MIKLEEQEVARVTRPQIKLGDVGEDKVYPTSSHVAN
jgi:hypothetical protein